MVKDFRVIYKGVKVGGEGGGGGVYSQGSGGGGGCGRCAWCACAARADCGEASGATPASSGVLCNTSGTHCFAHCFAILKITFQICINHSNIVFAYPFPAGPGRARRGGAVRGVRQAASTYPHRAPREALKYREVSR